MPDLIRTSLVAAALLASMAPSMAAPVDARASYVLTLGGINVATFDVDLSDDGRRYELDLSAKVAGLGNLVASGTARVVAKGASGGASLSSSAFDLETRANGERFTVDVTYDGSNVSAFK